MSEHTTYDCQSITELKNEDDNVIGYQVVDANGVSCFYPQCMTLKFKDQPQEEVKKGEKKKKKVRKIQAESTGRLALSNVVKSGSTVVSFKQECFCMDDADREYCIFTTDGEPE